MRKKLTALFLVAILLFAFSGCSYKTTMSTVLKSHSAKFSNNYKKEYRVELGSQFYFDYAVLDDKPLEYTVMNEGEEINVLNYSFIVNKTSIYDVTVTFSGEKDEIAKFTVLAVDDVGPCIALEYYKKFVSIGERVALPQVSVLDKNAENISWSYVLKNGETPVETQEGFFTASAGEYVYEVTAIDGVNNVTTKTARISAGNVFNKNIAINWSAADGPDYCVEIENGTFSASTENVYGGFESSFKVTLPIENKTTCITLKNSLIKDISDYNYICFYVYNDMSQQRQLSFNWSGDNSVNIASGGWTSVVLPINEALITSSFNSYLRKHGNWKSLDGMRMYIQDTTEASGNLYFSDIFLVNMPSVSEFDAECAEFVGGTNKAGYKSAFAKLDLEYGTLMKSEVLSDESGFRKSTAKFLELYKKDTYNEKVLAYGDADIPIPQLVPSGDTWTRSKSVSRTDKYKYGNEKGSFMVSFKPGLGYANTRLINPSVYTTVNSGKVSFYVLNKTGLELEVYSNATGLASVSPDENKWQKVTVLCLSNKPITNLPIYIRVKDQKVKTSTDKESKVYISNIYYEDVTTSGKLLNSSDPVDWAAKSRKWVSTDYTISSEKMRNGVNTFKVTTNKQKWGATGIYVYIPEYLRNPDVNTGYVTFAFDYFIESKTDNLSYISFSGTDSSEASERLISNGMWKHYVITYTAKELKEQMVDSDFLLLRLTKNLAGIWTGDVTSSVFYFTDINYTLEKLPSAGSLISVFDEEDAMSMSGKFLANDISVTSERQYNGANTFKITTKDIVWGAAGIKVFVPKFLRSSYVNANGVTFTFNYYIESKCNALNYICFSGVDGTTTAQKITTGGWNNYEVTITAEELRSMIVEDDYLLLRLTSNAKGSWTGESISSIFYVTDVNYKMN